MSPGSLTNMACEATLFREFDLDFLFHCVYAPGQSAINPVERAMSFISRWLQGIVLDPFTHGRHIDGSGQVVDEHLCRRNFEAALEHVSQRCAACSVEDESMNGRSSAVRLEQQQEEERVAQDFRRLGVQPHALKNDGMKNLRTFLLQHCQSDRYSFSISKCRNPLCDWCRDHSPRSTPFQERRWRYVPSPQQTVDGKYVPLDQRLGTEEAAFSPLPSGRDLYVRSLRKGKTCDYCGFYAGCTAFFHMHVCLCQKQAEIKSMLCSN